MANLPSPPGDLTPGQRRFWKTLYAISGSVLVCCVVVIIAGYTFGSLPSWIYWLALGSGFLAMVSAFQLKSDERDAAAEEGTHLSRTGARSSSSRWDDLNDLDD
ncbi:MAG: hypothetical protein JNM58_13415 [Xanthomonadaceae bacterium]|nr:hypothetical protein [Xanthomonadaceae bacterium]